tara:strand:+ start:4398 stop:5663 length:1266 start_codon:yes stop_codon:yes gene_type:complete
MNTAIIGDLGKVSMCKRVMKHETRNDGEIPFFKISTFGDTPKTYISKKLFNIYKEKFSYPKKGDVLISAAGTIGKTVIFDGNDAYFQDSNIVWIDNDETLVINSYLYYYYQTEPWIATSGSTIKRLYNNDIRNLKIHYPDKSKQRKIAKVLSDLDAKIVLNKKINSELESMAKLIYNYWFVQFDFPDENGRPYKSSGGKMIYNEELKKNIPEGWEVGELRFWIDRDKSGDWGKEKSEGNYTEKVSCVRGADINGLNGQGKVKAPKRYILNKNSHKILEAGDLIIEISGGSPTQSTGRLGYIIDSTLERFENPLICSNFCRAITLTDRKYIYNFIQLWNRLYNAGVLFGWEGKTSGIKNLLFDSFISNYSQPIPEYKLVEKYYDKVDPIYTKIQHNLKENEKLAELRDWLLPMLMNGQISVN